VGESKLDAHPCLTRILDRWYVKLKVKTCPLLQFPFLWYEHVQNILWRFPKIGKKPKSSILNRIFHFKPSILEYHHFRTPPYV
jgi:hypothetical protein